MFGVGADLVADDVDDLLGECFDDGVLVLLLVVDRGMDDGSGASLVFPAADGLAEGEDDFGAGAVGEVGGGGGYGRGHAEEVDPDAALFFGGVLVEYKGGFAVVAEAVDEGAQRAVARNDGLAGPLAQRAQVVVDGGILGYGCHAGDVESPQSAFEADQFPVAGVGGDDDLRARVKVRAGCRDEFLVFPDALLCPFREPEEIRHGARETFQRLDEDRFFFGLGFGVAENHVQIGEAVFAFPFGEKIGAPSGDKRECVDGNAGQQGDEQGAHSEKEGFQWPPDCSFDLFESSHGVPVRMQLESSPQTRGGQCFLQGGAGQGYLQAKGVDSPGRFHINARLFSRKTES